MLKDRRARARFVNATLYMCLSSWKALSRELKRQVQVLDAEALISVCQMFYQFTCFTLYKSTNTDT